MKISSLEVKMGTRDFNWETCPFCGCDFQSRCEILGAVKPSDLKLKEMKIHCNSCGTTYLVERVPTWQASLIETGKPLRQEIDEFFENRDKRIIEHLKSR
jgi:transcription elongation factor Elf1